MLSESVLAAAPLLPAPQEDVGSLVRLAEEFDKKDAFQDSIPLYERAIEKERGPREREELQRKLLNAQKRYFVQIVTEQIPGKPEVEQIRLLGVASRLNVVEKANPVLGGIFGGLDKKVQQAAKEADQLGRKLTDWLGNAAKAAIRNKELSDAERNLTVGLRVHPQHFKESGLDRLLDEVQQTLARADRLVEEAARLMQEKKFLEAKGRLTSAVDLVVGHVEASAKLREIAGVEAEFRTAFDQGVSLAGSKHPEEARKAYARAQELHRQLAGAEDDDIALRISRLDARIAETKETLKALEEADEAFGKKDWQRAVERYDDYLAAEPDHPEVARKRDQAESRRLVAQADELRSRGRFTNADQLYGQAVDLDPSNDEASRLLKRSLQFQERRKEARQVNQAHDCRSRISELAQLLDTANQIDAYRFRTEDLERLGECTVPPVAPEQIVEGLRPLLEGRYQEALRVFAPLLEQAEEAKADNPHLHAYVGAANFLAYLAGDCEDQSLLDAAVVHLRLTLESDPEYRFSARLFSPRLLNKLEEVRQTLRDGS